MSTLYIANCTSQALEFLYRLPAEDGSNGFQRKVYMQRIPPGMQQRIHNECPTAVLKAIIQQHEKYGLIPVEEVVRTKAFVGMCYSFDGPVDLDRFEYAFDHNKGVLHDRGVEQREAMALAVDKTLTDQFDEVRHGGGPVPGLRGVDIEVLEDSDNPAFSQAMRIDHGKQRADGRMPPVAEGRRGLHIH